MPKSFAAIVPARAGWAKSLLISKLFPGLLVYRHPHLFAAIRQLFRELAYCPIPAEARHSTGQRQPALP